MIKIVYNRFLIIWTLASSLSLAAPVSYAEVLPAPQHPGHFNIIADAPEEHSDAADHHEETADYHNAMVFHLESLAREHKNRGHLKLAEQYEALAKSHKIFAEQHKAIAKTHEEYAEGIRAKAE